VSAEHLVAHFRWLQEGGFTPVSVDQILAAEAGQGTLPANPVLLTFDDGLLSFYTRVFPLLQLFDYPAVVSVVSGWIDSDTRSDSDGEKRHYSDFVTWDQLREMQASGLVDIGSHTHDLHKGIPGNPQGNLQPAAVTRQYADGGHYEDECAYVARVTKDLAASVVAITRETGQPPKVITWPFGAYNDTVADIAASFGMRLSLTLEPDDTDHGDLLHRGRLLLVDNPSLADLSAELMLPGRVSVLRVAQVDLDYIYDPDPAQQEANLGRLLDRVKELGISHVFLQAFADPDGDGAADALYFPNRHLPMRADLFSRAAWQLKTRSDVRVYAWMPMLSFVGGPFDSSWRVVTRAGASESEVTLATKRLSPFHQEAIRHIGEVYEDLATYAKFDGLLFHDDGQLTEEEDFGDAATAIYREELGVVPTDEMLEADAALRAGFAELKTRALIELTDQLADRVRRHLPHIRTARNLFASAILDPDAAEYLAQDYDAFLEAYDHVALMAMPDLEGEADTEGFLRSLVAGVSTREVGFERTIFELQTIDWAGGTRIDSNELKQTLRWLQSLGVRHLGYYPDDFIAGHPELEAMRQGISLTDSFEDTGR
jgi:biofilm PGA synthesis lipoprotein PgaB